MKLTRDFPSNYAMAQWQPSDHQDAKIIGELFAHFGAEHFTVQSTRTGVPVVWLPRELLQDVIGFLRKVPSPFVMLFDLSATDERLRSHRDGLPPSDFTVFYHLISIDRNADVMLKVALAESDLHLPTITNHFPNANWYEREVWDLMGITFDGHPHLTRIMMPKNWQGHPLRKDPSAHGAFRLVLQLDGEEIRNCVPDIGYHHRGAEKMGERQSWHSYIPYTDRVEYLGGVMNNLPYVLAVEKLAGIKVPQRVDMIRVMMAELFRIQSHLLFLGTYIQDVGAMTPVFFTFTDRQKIYTIIEAITGARMHPAWFRIGGVAHDLPVGWARLIQENLLNWLPKRLMDYEKAAMRNSILRGRTIGVAPYTTEQALAWGVTGGGLRATGLNFDVRKWRPYSGYDQFEFEVPVGANGDVYDRGMMRLEEMRQSLRIIEQCVNNMPEGPFKADHPLTTPPPKDRTLQDIETLITHFLQVSWGPVMPAAESFQMIEATKGINSYYLTSDGSTMSYRTRIRTPSFAHLQQIPSVIKNSMVSDLIAYLGSIDFVMSDVDR